MKAKTARRLRLARNIALGAAALLALILLTVVIAVRTDWFRDFVKGKIISATEASTGGKVELGSFDFNVTHLRATVNNFVIHGGEPVGAAPFLRVARVEVAIRLFTSFRRIFDISQLRVERPEANVIVLAAGRTNIPEPQRKAASNSSPLEQVVNLAVGHFELNHGAFTFDSRRQPLNIRANNLRANFTYNFLSGSYQGQLALQPLYVVAGHNTPVNFTVTLPLRIQKDSIEVRGATISTPVSTLSINGALENVRNPKITAHLNGTLATADLKNLADLPLAGLRQAPSALTLDANAVISDSSIQVTGFRASFGASNIEASGLLKDPKNSGALAFKTRLALNELSPLLKLDGNPAGIVILNGNARLDAANQYDIAGNIDARKISFRKGATRLENVNLLSALHITPRDIELKGLNLTALGGKFSGNVSLHDFNRYQVEGQLASLDIRSALHAIGQTLPYDGVISGAVKASGSVEAPFAKSAFAQAHLTIAPAPRGIPVSGRLNADYNGASDNVVIGDSFLALPHTRLTLNGSLGKRLNVALTTHDVSDLLAAVSSTTKPAVTLSGAGLQFTGTVTGTLTQPRIAGHLTAARFTVEGRQFDSLTADLAASGAGASVTGGILSRAAMQARFTASAGLRNWSPEPREPLTASISVQNGDLADVMVLAGQPAKGYSGSLTASVQLNGTLGNPQGNATLQLAAGTLAAEPFDRAQAQINLTDQLVTVPAAFIQAGPGRADLTAEFQHPRDSFTTGRLHARIQTGQLNLARLTTVHDSSGELQVNTEITGDLDRTNSKAGATTELSLTAINADLAARAVRLDGQNYGDLTATARTTAQTVAYNLTSSLAGSSIHATGRTELVKDYPTTADATIANLPLDRLLVLAKRTGIPARGTLAGAAHLTGTLTAPRGSGDLTLTKAVLYDEPLDTVHARFDYLDRSIDIPQLEIVSGSSRLDASARYDHPAGSLEHGDVQFKINSTRLDLARIHNIQSRRPGLAGNLQLTAAAEGKISPADPRILVTALNASVAATNLTAQGRNFGSLTLTASTTAASQLTFALDSNLADAAIKGTGTARLTGDYPMDARLTFSNLLYTHIQSLLGTATGQPAFEAVADGQFSLRGPAIKPEQLTGSVQLTRLNLTTIPRPGLGKPVSLDNQGPIAATLDHNVIRIQSARITGPETDLETTGTAALTTGALDLTVKANANLNILPNFNRDIYSSGKLALATTVKGTLAQPLLNGQLSLQGASFNYNGMTNGISNANGVVVFNGASATIRTLTAESGGGALTASGFATFAPTPRFGLRTHASDVRVRVQEGVSVVVGGDLRLTGTPDNSVVAGTILVDQVTWNQQSDIGSILSRAAPPIQSASAPSPLLENMKLDIRIRSSAGLGVQASLAQNLQADADLRVRGTAAQPGILGRININEGELVFFGSIYTVNNGTIAFYNPLRIAPVLDLSLSTQANGVDVVLRVTGPVDDMKLTYTSNPPLQFSEIIALLASGKAPTSDPTLLRNQPQMPQQSFQQMGESAILGKALVDPVSSRLQRVFGVTQLKIDPAFQTGSSVPTARLTLQQRINDNLTFTYTSALDDPNGQIVKIEWAFDPKWSAVVTRDQNGLVSLNFFYKRQFR